MMRRDRRRRDDLPLTADINVTSLVDVAFTLLVIFIITAPVLQGGIEVSVPEADVDPVTTEDRPFFVSVLPDGRIFVEESELTIQQFRSSFSQLAAAGDIERVYIRGDSTATWARMLQVMGVVKEAARESGLNWVMVGEVWEND